MDEPQGTRVPETLARAERLWELINSNWTTQALHVAARLQIADLLADGPMSAEALATATGAHAPSLRRLLRALATIEICVERADGTFELTPLGALLQAESAMSLRSWALYSGGNMWPIWGKLLDSVQTGQSARTLLHGTEGFQHLEQNPETAAIFNRSMVELTRLIAHGVLRVYDFAGQTRIVDVGGGYGELLGAVLAAHPAASGVLFDLPHAIENGRRHLEAAGLADRCELVAGDFFESVPGGADVYMLKSVLHNWNDERCARILANCRRAMAAGGRLIVVERIMPERMGVSPDHQAIARSDLNMLIALAARERTEAEFRALLGGAGFEVVRILPAELTYSVIEAIPVADMRDDPQPLPS